MEISLDQSISKIKVQSYQAGSITINGVPFTNSIAITNELIHPPINLENVNELELKLLKSLEFTRFEVILIGTGEKLQFPSWDLIEEAQCLGSPLEIMSTGAACRTFTVLADEGRKVLAILFP